MASPFGYLKNTPFLRYLLFLSIGILAYAMEIPLTILGLISFLIAFVVIMGVWKFGHSKNTTCLLLGHLGIAVLGFLLSWHIEKSSVPTIGSENQKPKAYAVYITSQISTERYEAALLGSYQQNWQKASGKVVLTLKGITNLHLYDTLYLYGAPKLIKAPLNPEEFDYQAYSKHRGIFLQHYVTSQQIVAHQPYKGFSLQRVAYDLRNYFSQRLRRFLSDPNIASIAEALILGMRSEISPELIKAYAETGTIHVLAVSGMHVGLLFASIVWVFSSTIGSKYKLTYSIVALLCIWFFALVTGFSASVLRATVMYTVYQVGVMYHRKVNLPNTLFSSAFIILILQPFMLLDVGFQLSFFAVLGIILFQPFFQNILETQSMVFKNLRDLITVSISAQLGVLPLSLFYFKQFPNLFVVSNLLEVSISTIALYIGLLCMLCMSWDFALLYLCKILSFLIDLMNLIAQYLSDLPFAITKAYIYSWEAICIASIVITFVMYLRWRRIKYLKLTFGLTIVLSSTLSLRYYRVAHSERLVIYAQSEEGFIDVYKNGALLRMSKVSNNSALKPRVLHMFEMNQLKNSLYDQVQTMSMDRQKPSVLLTVNGRKVEIINEKHARSQKPADIVYLNYFGNPKPPSYNCLLVVKHETMAQKLRLMGYTNIHCLDTKGALDI